jgi:hypothetical protein
VRAASPPLVLVALAGVLGLAACGGDDPDDSEPAKPVGRSSAGSVVQFADCRDWRKGTVEERHATVDALRGQLTAQSSKTAESALSDERAYEIFQKACSPDYAGHLRLYKLYVRAQGFAPLSE